MEKNLVFIISLFISNCSFSQIAKDTITNKIDEITVTGNTKTVSTKNGNIKVDITNSIYKSVSNTIDLLSKLPTIQISANKETISVIGKGNALLYIDNQRIAINDLNTLTIDEIKSIEIINNPSSKYESEGRAVILISRKISKREGFKIDLTETTSLKKSFNNYFGINASIKKKKLEWKANFNYNDLSIWEKHGIDYQIPEANIVSNYVVEAITKRPQFIFGGGLFYKINEDNYLSFNINSRNQNDTFGINTITYNKQNSIHNNILTHSDNKETKDFTNSFFNYNKKCKSANILLFTGLQYTIFKEVNSSFIENNYNATQYELSQNRQQKFTVNVFSGRIDLEKNFKNDMKWELGGLYLTANSKTNLDVTNFTTNQLTQSNYNFSEQNTAGYTQLSGNIKKLSYIVGVRAENTMIEGKFLNQNNALIKKNYTNLFPKIQLDIPIDSSKTLMLNYSKSIVRPNYSATSQGATYINPYFLYRSNINLDPTINNELSCSFQYNDRSIKLSYFKNSQPVYQTFLYNSLENVLSLNDQNFDTESGFNLEFTLPFTYRFWTATNVLSIISNKIEDASATQIDSKPYAYYYSNHVFKLPSDYIFSLTAWGTSPQKEGFIESNNTKFIMDCTLSKTFFSNWDFTLSYNDIFKNMTFNQNFTINNISSKTKYYTDSNEFSIAIKYTFGQIKTTQFKEKNIDDTINRVR
jgi:Outer membrane protein beta-barrel family